MYIHKLITWTLFSQVALLLQIFGHLAFIKKQLSKKVALHLHQSQLHHFGLTL